MPQFDNLICSELGRLTEQLVTAFFGHTRKGVVDATKKSMDRLGSRYKKNQISVPKKTGKGHKHLHWKAADFFLGKNKIVETKYRFNSYGEKDRQIMAGRIYTSLGFKPVFLHLSPDFREGYKEEFEAEGWTVYVGQDALDWIEHHTGFDLIEALFRVSEQPAVRARILEAHGNMVDRVGQEIKRDFRYSDPEIQSPMLDFLATSRQHLADLTERAKRTADAADLAESLEVQAERLCDAKMKEIDIDAVGALLSGLEDALGMDAEAALNALCVKHLTRLEKATRADVLSRVET